MSDLEPITRAENFWVNEGDLEPITRKEQYIKHLYDETQVVPEYPKTREEYFINKAGEELHDVTIKQLTVTENKTYSEEGVAYSPVIGNVPQPTLTTLDVTENGTYTAPSGTAYDEVEVDVPLPENAYLLKDIPNTPSPIATFTDGSPLPMPKLEVAVEPQQDLHGYDSPWVGGAGKNKFDSDTVLSTFTKNNNKYVGMPSSIVNDYVISGGFKTNTRYTLSYKAYNNTSTPSNFRFVFSYTDETEEIIGGFVDTTTEKVIVGTSAENKTISKIKRNYGNGVEITLYDIQLEEGTTATAYEPYSNICPIIGWDEVNVGVSGKNLVNISDKTMTTSGYVFAISRLNIRKGMYTFSAKTTTSANMSITVYGNGVAFINTGFNGKSISFNATDTITDIRLYASGAGTFEEMMLEEGSTATAYEPYNGHTYTIQFKDGSNPLTVYGGTLDVTSGVLTVDKGYIASYNGETLPSTWISDRDVYAEGATPTISAEVCYELATPQTIQLTPTAVKSLLGTNNLWADTGDVLEASYFSKEV